MQSEDVDFEVPGAPCLNSLDSALHHLGMLASSTESRREYLRETRRNPYLNMVRINTRYVSNVSIGFRVRPLTLNIRYKPYMMVERHRTRSENNDSGDNSNTSHVNNDIVDNDQTQEISQLKKAKSLESIIAESNTNVNLKNLEIPHCPELEIVSNCIQNLKVAD